MIEIAVHEDYAFFGTNIYITEKFEGSSRRLMRIKDGGFEWEDIDHGILPQPTIRLPEDTARALLDSLMRHFQGASDMHTVRADMLTERARVDKLTDVITAIALHSTGSTT